jgi:hypothetical protein
MGFDFDEGIVAHRTQSFILSNLPQYHPRIAAFGLELCPMDSAPSLNLAMNLPSNSNRKFRVQVLNCQFPTPIETSRSSSLILHRRRPNPPFASTYRADFRQTGQLIALSTSLLCTAPTLPRSIAVSALPKTLNFP